jgi:hypothetical protein
LKLIFYCIIIGAILFKVYIVGEAIKVVRRFSLPNVSKCDLEKVSGVCRLPRVSSASASADDADLEPGVAGEITSSFFFPRNILASTRLIAYFNYICYFGVITQYVLFLLTIN